MKSRLYILLMVLMTIYLAGLILSYYYNKTIFYALLIMLVLIGSSLYLSIYDK